MTVPGSPIKPTEAQNEIEFPGNCSCAICRPIKPNTETRRLRVMDDTKIGLYGKYEVKRHNDLAGKHDDCWYFVMDPQHDPIAQHALLAYADEAKKRGYQQLREDLYMRVMLIQKAQRENPS